MYLLRKPIYCIYPTLKININKEYKGLTAEYLMVQEIFLGCSEASYVDLLYCTRLAFI